MAILVVQPGNGIAVVDRAGNPAEFIVEGVGDAVIGIGADNTLAEGVVFKTAAAAIETLIIFIFLTLFFKSEKVPI
ncbi:hypothetical protein QT397_14310 [Microbulbifer sp. MKSA007]|nr:hypothetical protein QT397_14310 [Microbulbifer sp. MKSA007]